MGNRERMIESVEAIEKKLVESLDWGKNLEGNYRVAREIREELEALKEKYKGSLKRYDIIAIDEVIAMTNYVKRKTREELKNEKKL